VNYTEPIPDRFTHTECGQLIQEFDRERERALEIIENRGDIVDELQLINEREVGVKYRELWYEVTRGSD
jgi:hypothetical protein